MSTTNRGRAWEARLEVWHDAYRRERRAVVQKNEPKAKNIAGRIVYERKGAPDFDGTLAGGRAVVFDAKDCRASRWSLKGLALHQARDLEAHHLAGAVAFVALRFQGVGYVLPWARLGPVYWRWVEKKGPASLSGDDVRTLGIPMGPDGWLGVLP